MKQNPGGDYRNVDSGELVEKGDSSVYPSDKFGELTAMKKERAMTAIQTIANILYSGARLEDKVGRIWITVDKELERLAKEKAKPSLLDDVEAWHKRWPLQIGNQPKIELLAIIDKHRGSGDTFKNLYQAAL